MIYWLESQPVAVIVIVGYAFCFSVAAVTFMVGTLLARTRFAEDLGSITPSLLTPLGVILGLLLVFLSSRVWTNVDRATAAVRQEATAVQELTRAADELPPTVADPIRNGARAYREWVRQEDWPGMMSGNASLRSRLPGLADATKALADYDATSSGQRDVQQVALAAIERVRDARRGRVLQSRAFIGQGQWLVVVALYIHVLLSIATIHTSRRVSMAIALSFFSSAFAVCFVLLLIYDRPFRSGGLTVAPVEIEAPLVQPAISH
jgi:hypothetical protein